MSLGQTQLSWRAMVWFAELAGLAGGTKVIWTFCMKVGRRRKVGIWEVRATEQGYDLVDPETWASKNLLSGRTGTKEQGEGRTFLLFVCLF